MVFDHAILSGELFWNIQFFVIENSPRYAQIISVASSPYMLNRVQRFDLFKKKNEESGPAKLLT
jgi:hypothetical protein